MIPSEICIVYYHIIKCIISSNAIEIKGRSFSCQPLLEIVQNLDLGSMTSHFVLGGWGWVFHAHKGSDHPSVLT